MPTTLPTVIRCRACSNRLTSENDGLLCESCALSYFVCQDCDNVITRHMMSAREAGYCRHCRETARFSFTPIGEAPWLGWELECESNADDFNIAPKETLRAFPDAYVTTKDDGSLSEYGFEIVSRPAPLSEHKNVCPRFFEAVQAGKLGRLTSWSNDTCGLHVHISRNSGDTVRPWSDDTTNPWQLNEHATALIVCFVNLPRNARFIQTIAGRDANSYTRFHRKTLATAARNTGDKYEAVNLCHNATLEFRIFKGTLNQKSFFKALEFTLALSQFCKSLYNVRKALSVSQFVKYVAENNVTYPFLDSFISNRWYGKPDRHGQINWRLKNNRKPPLPPVDHGNRSSERGI